MRGAAESLCPDLPGFGHSPSRWQFFGGNRAGHRTGGLVAGPSQKEKAETAQCGIVLLHSY